MTKLSKAELMRGPYDHGYDAAVNGANTVNCHFSIFNSRENTKEWERGNADAKRVLQRERGKRR